ncbi:MAG: hypothetical protein FD181_2422 [Prolixibacteraceae bacterium]|nr:MAG: hypothetical protein FD181_2422 [Prolixibacteraceae bacterium]
MQTYSYNFCTSCTFCAITCIFWLAFWLNSSKLINVQRKIDGLFIYLGQTFKNFVYAP